MKLVSLNCCSIDDPLGETMNNTGLVVRGSTVIFASNKGKLSWSEQDFEKSKSKLDIFSLMETYK